MKHHDPYPHVLTFCSSWKHAEILARECNTMRYWDGSCYEGPRAKFVPCTFAVIQYDEENILPAVVGVLKSDPFYLPGGAQCQLPHSAGFPACSEAAGWHCDNCGRYVCEEHIARFRGHSAGDTDQCRWCLDQVAP